LISSPKIYLRFFLVEIFFDELIISKIPLSSNDTENVIKSSSVTVDIDTSITDSLMENYYIKLFGRRYQDARKSAGLKQTDKIEFYYSTPNFKIQKIVEQYEPVSQLNPKGKEYSLINPLDLISKFSGRWWYNFKGNDIEIGKMNMYFVK